MKDPSTVRTLVFPSGVPAARAYAQEAGARGEMIVGASSLAFDPSAGHFDTWIYLPNVTDERFAERLNAIVEEYGIDQIYAPVSAAHWVIGRLIASGVVTTPLIGEMPIRRHAREHAELMARSRETLSFIQRFSDGSSKLTEFEVAAVLAKAMSFYGESDETKIAAMSAVLGDTPNGDIIEIGVLTGRSCAVLEFLARRYAIGPVLAIDPWAYESSIQRDSPRELQEMVDVWDASVPFETFIVQLLPIARPGLFNYLKRTSASAYPVWSGARRVSSAEFGETSYLGEIAVLHIDGNHDYSAVSEDCKTWLPHLKPGGWLILDDYVWLHGDGPRRAGDQVLAQEAAAIERAFVCGKSLFVKRSRHGR